jgi:hypothetical protein
MRSEFRNSFIYELARFEGSLYVRKKYFYSPKYKNILIIKREKLEAK